MPLWNAVARWLQKTEIHPEIYKGELAVDLRKIKKLIELVEESGIAELEVKSGEEAVRITMLSAAGPNTAGKPAVMAVPSATAAESGAAAVGGTDAPAQQQRIDRSPAGQPLKSPLSGTFYAAPSPDAQVFIDVGGKVARGDVLCIVESMKMMNRIEADRAGVLTAVLAINGEPVESGQPLFLIDG